MEKNKIQVDSFKTSISDNNPLFLEIDSKTKIDIIVSDGISSKLIIIGNNDYDLNIKLGKKANLIVK